jgi:Uma2 family endonuclease
LKGKPCKIYGAQFDVRLEEHGAANDDRVVTVVQPDLVIICDRVKIDERGCKGAPDIVIEIASPSTASYDLTTKFDLYQKHAVQEYWIVHPEEQTVMVFKLQLNGSYGQPDRYGRTGRIPVTLLGELVIDLEEVFAV